MKPARWFRSPLSPGMVTDEQRKADEIRSLNQRLQSAVFQVREKNIKIGGYANELKGTQAQMVQAEKMASIGQLAAAWPTRSTIRSGLSAAI